MADEATIQTIEKALREELEAQAEAGMHYYKDLDAEFAEITGGKPSYCPQGVIIDGAFDLRKLAVSIAKLPALGFMLD